MQQCCKECKVMEFSFEAKTKACFLPSAFNPKWRSDSAPWTDPVWNLKRISIIIFFHCAFYWVTQLLYNEHVSLLQTNVGLWTPTKTHSLSESIIQYVQSEITDDQTIGTTWCQEALPSRLAHTFQVKRGPAKKHLKRLPITSSNDNTGDKWRQ